MDGAKLGASSLGAEPQSDTRERSQGSGLVGVTPGGNWLGACGIPDLWAGSAPCTPRSGCAGPKMPSGVMPTGWAVDPQGCEVPGPHCWAGSQGYRVLSTLHLPVAASAFAIAVAPVLPPCAESLVGGASKVQGPLTSPSHPVHAARNVPTAWASPCHPLCGRVGQPWRWALGAQGSVLIAGVSGRGRLLRSGRGTPVGAPRRAEAVGAAGRPEDWVTLGQLS